MRITETKLKNIVKKVIAEASYGNMGMLNDANAAVVDAIIQGLEAAFSEEGKFEVYDLEVNGGEVDVTLVPADGDPSTSFTFKVTVSTR